MNKQVFWAYNESFKFYHPVPLAGKRAFAFIEKQKNLKGGHWILHSVVEYDEWWRNIGSHKEFLKMNNL